LLARIYQRLGDPDAADAEIERTELLPAGDAVWDDPEMGFGAMYLRDGSMLNTLAELLRARGDMDGCLQRLRQIVESEPENLIAKEKLAATLVEVQRYDAAQDYLDETLAQHPDSPDLVYLRGRVHMAKGEKERACQQFERTVELKPDYDEAYAYLGRVCLELGEQAAAVAALREAIRLSPAQVDSYRVFGRALVAIGNYDEAIDALRQARRLAPNDDDLRRQLIETLLAARRNAEAIEQLQEAAHKAQEPKPFQELLNSLQVRPDEPAPAGTK
jgi:tetratricopeptide (TPR) repeat protein